ncbi:PREDICTED: nudC domain-containing protein 1 [Dufourea novaeangliae]|uniref:NudC domain-containing protein 1 n=1 Tax=Dufourea novaeangliae TaxID=178035 RepID=A0A154P8M6_DUFNO|nr:PREDICTED: nudC domain-containing protein 1 [Dufourea novaeangliae]KZC07704.1 NudC domain-containing protein 1 [Dufourea novaeangliae]
MTKIIELRPDKNLINSKFEKYQFSTDEVPVASEINLTADVHRLELTSNRDSLLETRLFAFHNHLFKNPYDTSCWFIDKNWMVWRFNKDGALEEIHHIHDINANVQNVLYNPSIAFTNNNVVVISDGGNCLKVLLALTQEHAKVFSLSNAEPGIILDVRYVNATSTITVALCSIKSTGEKKFTSLLLLTYTWKNVGESCESFEFTYKETLKVNGAVEYAYIEDDGKYVHSICQDYITFEHPKVQEVEDNKKDSEKSSEIKIPRYCWSQDEDLLTVWIKVDREQQKNVKVNVTPLELSVTLNGIVLIQGQCQHRLDESLTTWRYEEDTFKIELFKYESGLMWNELIKGDSGGEHLPNEELATEIHSRLAHLCTDQTDSKLEGQPCIGFNSEQLEECDLEGKDNLLQRINLVTQENTHLAMLGTNNHVLFTYKTKSGQAICLRHDNDGCLWITGKADDTKWNIENRYIFPGFGYVEASKSNKKFCVSPYDGSYVAILEHARYIFLYKRPELNSQIEKQWIVDLGPETFPIMGAVATNKYLTVLTKNKLYRLHTCF